MAKKGNVLELFARLRAVKAQAGVLEQEERAIKQQLALLVPALGTLILGIFPTWVLEFASRSSAIVK